MVYPSVMFPAPNHRQLHGIFHCRRHCPNKAWNFAEHYYNAPFLYIMASGSAYAQAYGFAICSLQEMQWMDCCYLDSAEYFHGPFEVTDKDHIYILLKSVGKTE